MCIKKKTLIAQTAFKGTVHPESIYSAFSTSCYVTALFQNRFKH